MTNSLGAKAWYVIGAVFGMVTRLVFLGCAAYIIVLAARMALHAR